MKTIDFFGKQEQARRSTWGLVVLFAFAVMSMIVVIYLAVIVLFAFSRKNMNMEVPAIVWFQPGVLVIVAMATLSIVALGSLYKIMELRRGGEQVALALGGRLVQAGSGDISEQRLLNVVEEMAIASGVAVPPAYLLENERGINAFAAGLTPDDAVVAVSRGALDYLSRDELQGVVAHEFSHILNGDMRFNLRLIGILHGILVVGLIGYYMMRLSGGGSRSSSGRGKGSAQIILLGVVIMVVGYIGLFFGRLIKAAVSRQREYLADASAVQFTRNPDGVSGALKKIGGLYARSYVDSPAAETASHMFFGSAIRRWAHSPYQTHPPLDARIRAIEPTFNGIYPKIEPLKRRIVTKAKKPAGRAAGEPLAGRSKALDTLFPGLGFSERFPIEPALVLAAVGAPTMEHMEYSSNLLSHLPPAVEIAAREPFGARCIVFAFLLDDKSDVRDRQLALISQQDGQATRNEAERLSIQLNQIGKSARLPLIEIAQGTLRQISPEQYRRFRERVLQLIKADEKVNLFEFIMQCVLLNHLDRHFALTDRPRVQYYGLKGVTDKVAVLMSALAHVGSRDPATAQKTYEAAIAPLQLDADSTRFLDRSSCTLPRLKSALETLATCSIPIRKRLLGASTLCVAADGTITVGEAELVRAVASAVDCPIPPILPGKVEKYQATEGDH